MRRSVTWSTTVAFAVLLWGAWPGEMLGRNPPLEAQAGRSAALHLGAKKVAELQGDGAGQEVDTVHTMNLSWTVKNVSANGDAEITLRIDRVRMRVEQPPFMPFEFDSSPNKLEVPGAVRIAERQIKAMAGAEFTFKLRPTGEVDDLKISRQTLKKLLRRSTPGGGRAGNDFRTGTEGHAAAIEPAPFSRPGLSSPARPGQQARQDPHSGLGTLVVDKVFTFQGPDPKTPRLLTVGMEAQSVARARRERHGQDPDPGREGEPDLRRRGRPHRQQPQQPEDGDGHLRSRPGDRPIDRDDLDDDARALGCAAALI